MLSAQINTSDLTKIRSIADKVRNTGGLMSEVGQYMTSSTQRKIDKGIQPENAPLTRAWKKGGLPLRDTGKYMSSISHRSDNAKAVIGTKAIQGPLIHQGGTVKPKKAKKLYIPAGWKTRQMMRKFGLTPGKCIEGMKKAGYKIWKSKSGKALMAAQKGAKGKKAEAFVLFVLKDRVTIPARKHFFIDSVDRQVLMEKAAQWLKKK
jgi:phage gpG-like protein